MESIFLAIRDFETSRNFASLLSDDYKVETFTNEVDALNALLEKQYACIIIDFSETLLDGEAILNYLINSKQIDNQPVCVIIDPPDIQKELTLFNRNCAEIFNKPIDPIVTRKRIQNVITISKLQHNVKEYEQKLITDPMTGLLNKDGFSINVRKYLKTKEPAALLMCDMDGLKYINDNFSHLTGDSIICSVGDYLKRDMPENALVAHMSGDEFCVLLTGINDEETITQICQNFQKDVIKKVLLPDLSRPVTTSIGIALFPESASTFEKLSSKADHALLYVKNHGKNGFKFHAARDDREEMLKGRQECTKIPIELMLKKREGEDIQTWLKFGEFRVVFITYQRYIPNALPLNLCQMNIIDKKNPDNPDCKKISTINDKITTFIQESQYAGIFSWYSLNQLLILSVNENTIPRGVEKLKSELSAELSVLHVDIELKLKSDFRL